MFALLKKINGFELIYLQRYPERGFPDSFFVQRSCIKYLYTVVQP